MASSDARRAEPVEPEASLRAELLEQIAGAQATLESNIEDLRRAVVAGGHGVPGQAEAQLQGLSKLQHRVAHAHGASLAAIRAEVNASVAATQAFIQQARTAGATAEAAEVALHAASVAAHREVTSFVHDFYEKKIFDPYLRFASVEDEEAYRKREAERREAIEKALAEGTPEGNLRALELSKDQMRDAGAHGADRSPDYQPMLAGLEARDAELRGQLAAAPTEPAAQAKPVAAVATTDPLAALRAAGVSLADQTQEGHGVNARDVQTSAGRIPV